MKFLTATQDSGGYFNYTVAVDETNALAPVKPFRYAPPRPEETAAAYRQRIETEIESAMVQIKAAWLAAGSPAASTNPTLGVSVSTVDLAVKGTVF